MSLKQLAIVIPAYKGTFFKQTIESIVNQTCKDFTLYVGDDCSSYPMEMLISQYKDKIDIV
jgi:glycosyltransferase involved in cell wall biosynthesis